MDDEQQIWLQAHLTVQAYVQQVLLVGTITHAPDRQQALDAIGAGFRRTLQYRMLAPTLEMRPNDLLRTQAAAIRIFDDFLAQVRAGAGLASPASEGPDGG